MLDTSGYVTQVCTRIGYESVVNQENLVWALRRLEALEMMLPLPNGPITSLCPRGSSTLLGRVAAGNRICPWLRMYERVVKLGAMGRWESVPY